MEFKLNEKQAKKIADNIDTGFFLSGYGHFNLTTEEVAKVIQLAFESNGSKKVGEYYNELRKQNGL